MGVCMWMHVHNFDNILCYPILRETDTHTDRQRQTDRYTQRETDRNRQTDRDRQKETIRKRPTERARERAGER